MNIKIEATSTTEPIIVMERVFDAPRELVWAAFTDPKHVVHWYGGHGFSNPVCEMDVRPGGRWRHVMRTPSGQDFMLEFVFVEVVRPERISWHDVDHGKRKSGPPTCLNTVTFEARGDKTQWRLVARFGSIADRDLTYKSGFTRIVSEGSERLEAVAKGLAAAPRSVERSAP